MPRYVLIIDAFALIFAVAGFCMAFRQNFVRRLIGRPPRPPMRMDSESENLDPVTYILRIAGVMVMMFGIATGGMVTLFNLA